MASLAVSLGKPSLKARLEDYYTLVAPEQIADDGKWRKRFDAIWSKYGGTHQGEQKLARQLEKKYGTVVRFVTATTAALGAETTTTTKNEIISSTRVKKQPQQHLNEESWYELNEKERNSQCIDFLSDRFDPVAALLAENKTKMEKHHSWILESPMLDRVERFRAYLPTEDPLYRAVITNKKQPQESSKKSTTKPKLPSCFAVTAALHQTGPLSVLYRAFTNRQRIRVIIRYVNGIRGTLTGHLIAFDKHMNMILKDVEETYTPRQTDETLSNLEAELYRRRQATKSGTSVNSHLLTAEPPPPSAWTIRQRHMRQIMVRGDNVVAICKAAEEQTAYLSYTQVQPVIQSRYRQNMERQETPKEERVGTLGSLISLAYRKQGNQKGNRGTRTDYRR
jgi:small nuclear ribonucleoprotein (snRNP)-like protein